MDWSCFRRIATALLAAAACAVYAPASAQTARAESAADQVPAADSARILADARFAQARFERIRRRHFPWTWSSRGGDCDEIVGRFCYWHDDDEDIWEPPPEPAAVGEARARLVAQLGAAAARLPGDGWIAGQRVRYLVEADSAGRALAAARACRPTDDWWCTALVGFAHHSAHEWESADSAFSAALAAMPREERERWADPSVLVEGGWRDYRRAPAAERDSLEQRFWWLADPFWMLPGNDRRTEHFTRWVMDGLQQRAETPDGTSWGDDLRELLLRYGWWVGWERVRPRTFSLEQVSYIAHDPPKDRRFVPTAEVVADPYALTPEDWPLEADLPRAGYTPPYTRSVEPLEHQLALFRSGDSTVVVAAYELPDTAITDIAPVEAALILAHDESAPLLITRNRGVGRADALRLATETQSMVLSLEVLAGPDQPAFRARYGIRPPAIVPGVPGISDLLLLEDAEPLPESLTEAIRQMRGSNRLRTGERIVIYWELYGVNDADAMDISLALADADAGWLRRMGERLGLVREIQPIRLGWQEGVPGERGTIARSFAIEIPDAGPGLYTLRLAVTLPGREPLVAVREIEIER